MGISSTTRQDATLSDRRHPSRGSSFSKTGAKPLSRPPTPGTAMPSPAPSSTAPIGMVDTQQPSDENEIVDRGSGMSTEMQQQQQQRQSGTEGGGGGTETNTMAASPPVVGLPSASFSDGISSYCHLHGSDLDRGARTPADDGDNVKGITVGETVGTAAKLSARPVSANAMGGVDRRASATAIATAGRQEEAAGHGVPGLPEEGAGFSGTAAAAEVACDGVVIRVLISGAHSSFLHMRVFPSTTAGQVWDVRIVLTVPQTCCHACVVALFRLRLAWWDDMCGGSAMLL